MLSLLVAVQGAMAIARPPVVIVPGSLHSKLNVAALAHGSCAATSGTESMFLNWSRMYPMDRQECWIGRMTLPVDGPSDPSPHSGRDRWGTGL